MKKVIIFICVTVLGMSYAAFSQETDPYAADPNPVSGIINIDSEIQVNIVELFDLTGSRVLYADYVTDLLNLSKIKHGLYILKMHFIDGEILTRRIMKVGNMSVDVFQQN
jgi:hypothetical protein